MSTGRITTPARRSLSRARRLSRRRGRGCPGFDRSLNWAGDARYAERLVVSTAVALSVLAVLAGRVESGRRLVVQAKLLTRDQWRPLASGALWLAALTGAPTVLVEEKWRNLLRRHAGTGRGHLSFGDLQLVLRQDVPSRPGESYSPAFRSVLAVFGAVLYLSYRRRTLPTLLPAASLLAVLAVASISVVGQRLLFGTVVSHGQDRAVLPAIVRPVRRCVV